MPHDGVGGCTWSRPQGGYAVYRYEGSYLLLPGVSVSTETMARLSEYGELYPVSEATFARIREHGKILLSPYPMTASREAR